MRAPRHSSRPIPVEQPLSEADPPTRERFRFLSTLTWYGLPTLIVVAVCLYIGLVMVWGVYPPLIPVEGASMRPTLVTGDLVFVHSVDPKKLTVGQVIAVNVPAAAVEKYHLPSHIVHRIVSIEQTPSGPLFTTKGDSNAGADVFVTPAVDVVGIVIGHVPYLGMPLLFFRGIQGQIFLGSAAVIVLIYLLMGWAETRKGRSAEVLEALLLETRQLRELLERDSPSEPQSDQDRQRPSTRSAKLPFSSASASRTRTTIRRRRLDSRAKPPSGRFPP